MTTLRTNPLRWVGLPLVSGILALSMAAVGCSAGEEGPGGDNDNNGAGASKGPGGPGIPGGPGVPGSPGVPSGQIDSNRGVPVRNKVCDAAGNCTCLRLALLGTLDSAATDTDTQPFVDWLNGNSDGSAVVDMVTVKPALTAEWLAQYDILLVANTNAWHFTDEEKAAVQTWSAEGGGGIISLTGFDSTSGEPAASSQLISFSGVNYFAPPGLEDGGIANPHKGGKASPVYYKGGSENLKECLGWNKAYVAKDTTAVPFASQSGSLEDLTTSLDYVGAYHGWAVSVPESATVIATDPTSNQAIAVAWDPGKGGRVYAFGDEWVIFANQWQGQGSFDNTHQGPENKCYDPTLKTVDAPFHSAASLYQAKQFWYNAINWVAPPNECFTIIDDAVIIR